MRRHATPAMAEARGYASKLCTAPTPAVLILGKPTLCYHLLRRRACHRWLLRSERAPRASSFKLLVQLARHHGRPVQQSMVLEHHEYLEFRFGELVFGNAPEPVPPMATCAL